MLEKHKADTTGRPQPPDNYAAWVKAQQDAISGHKDALHAHITGMLSTKHSMVQDMRSHKPFEDITMEECELENIDTAITLLAEWVGYPGVENERAKT